MISQAFAQGTSAFGSFESLSSFVPLILIFVVFYFFLIRPQQKKAQQHREMVGNLRRGDHVVTNGGLMGTVVRVVDDREVEIEIAKGVQVRVVKGMVADVKAKTQPVPSDSAATKTTIAPVKKVETAPGKAPASKAPVAKAVQKKKVSKPVAAKAASKTPTKK